jgi:hypothetical protein
MWSNAVLADLYHLSEEPAASIFRDFSQKNGDIRFYQDVST